MADRDGTAKSQPSSSRADGTSKPIAKRSSTSRRISLLASKFEAPPGASDSRNGSTSSGRGSTRVEEDDDILPSSSASNIINPRSSPRTQRTTPSPGATTTRLSFPRGSGQVQGGHQTSPASPTSFSIGPPRKLSSPAFLTNPAASSTTTPSSLSSSSRSPKPRPSSIPGPLSAARLPGGTAGVKDGIVKGRLAEFGGGVGVYGSGVNKGKERARAETLAMGSSTSGGKPLNSERGEKEIEKGKGNEVQRGTPPPLAATSPTFPLKSVSPLSHRETGQLPSYSSPSSSSKSPLTSSAPTTTTTTISPSGTNDKSKSKFSPGFPLRTVLPSSHGESNNRLPSYAPTSPSTSSPFSRFIHQTPENEKGKGKEKVEMKTSPPGMRMVKSVSPSGYGDDSRLPSYPQLNTTPRQVETTKHGVVEGTEQKKEVEVVIPRPPIQLKSILPRTMGTSEEATPASPDLSSNREPNSNTDFGPENEKISPPRVSGSGFRYPSVNPLRISKKSDDEVSSLEGKDKKKGTDEKISDGTETQIGIVKPSALMMDKVPAGLSSPEPKERSDDVGVDTARKDSQALSPKEPLLGASNPNPFSDPINPFDGLRPDVAPSPTTSSESTLIPPPAPVAGSTVGIRASTPTVVPTPHSTISTSNRRTSINFADHDTGDPLGRPKIEKKPTSLSIPVIPEQDITQVDDGQNLVVKTPKGSPLFVTPSKLGDLGPRRPFPSPLQRGRQVSGAPSSSNASPAISGKRLVSLAPTVATSTGSPSSKSGGLRMARMMSFASGLSTKTSDVPASAVFGDDAVPLRLPHLDKYLEGIGGWEFGEPGEGMKADGSEERIWKEWVKDGVIEKALNGKGKNKGDDDSGILGRAWNSIKKIWGGSTSLKSSSFATVGNGGTGKFHRVDSLDTLERLDEDPSVGVPCPYPNPQHRDKHHSSDTPEEDEKSGLDSPTRSVLSSNFVIPGTKSSEPKDHSAARRWLVFPPLHLIPERITISALFRNRRSPPPIITSDVIFATAIDAVLGAEGSTYAIDLTNVELFRDLIQMIGTLLGSMFSNPSSGVWDDIFGSPRNGTHSPPQVTSSDWRKIAFQAVPSIIGLDFVSAFGMAVVWLWVFTLFTGLGLYEFWRMTGKGFLAGKEASGMTQDGRRKKEMEGEGFDQEDGMCDDIEDWQMMPPAEDAPIPLTNKNKPSSPRKSKSESKTKKVASKLKKSKKGEGWRESRPWKIFVVFLVSSIYMPLSKIAIGALVWSSDYWDVQNYYMNEDDPHPSPLGPSDKFYDPLDFCYRTTQEKSSGFFNNFNWAWAIVLVAVITTLSLTIWFPIRLWNVVNKVAPVVDPYTELGEKRRDSNAEYERLLEHDKQPFNFLYTGYRRKWAGFKAIYMVIKLVTVLITTFFTKDNCIFRHSTRTHVWVFSQGAQLGFLTLFLILQMVARPFIDRIQNNSDWVSRITYVVIALLGLLVALNVPGKDALNGWVLLLVTVTCYVLNGYFAIINTGFAQRLVKRIQKRIDFSIDLFSPHLDLPKHVARRIWQETFSAILLAGPEYEMPKDVKPAFAYTPPLAPYLLGFRGSQAERHVENIRILRSIGLEAYSKGVIDLKSHTEDKISLYRKIENDFTGPDCFWMPPEGPYPDGVTTFFGRAFAIPFPFAVVFKYDQGGANVVIADDANLSAYVMQNESREIQGRRRVRHALRAMNGRLVFAPYTETTTVGTAGGKWKTPWPLSLLSSKSRRGNYSMRVQATYRMGTLRIQHNSDLEWRKYNYNSGFDVTLEYKDGQARRPDGKLEFGRHLTLHPDDLGISEDFSLSPPLARLLKENRETIETYMPEIQGKLSDHANFFAREAAWKRDTLSYSFLMDVMGEDTLSKEHLKDVMRREEIAPHTRNLPIRYGGAVVMLEDRMQAVNRNRVTQWWYCLWDDIWRRNSVDVPSIAKYPAHFSPHYRSSICYAPLPRHELEEWLKGLGFWVKDGKSGYFNIGFLNRIYLYLDEIVFRDTNRRIPVRVGPEHEDVSFMDLPKPVSLFAPDKDEDKSRIPDHHFQFPWNHHDDHHNKDGEDQGPKSNLTGKSLALTYQTGGGTDHDDDEIRPREAFPFEELYDDPPPHFVSGQRRKTIYTNLVSRPFEAVKTWLGLVPYPHTHEHVKAPGVYFSLRKMKEGYEIPRQLEQV